MALVKLLEDNGFDLDAIIILLDGDTGVEFTNPVTKEEDSGHVVDIKVENSGTYYLVWSQHTGEKFWVRLSELRLC